MLVPTTYLVVICNINQKVKTFHKLQAYFFPFRICIVYYRQRYQEELAIVQYRSLQKCTIFFRHIFGKLNCKIVFINCLFLAIVMIDTIALFFSPQNLCSFITSYISWKVILDQYGPTWNYTQNIFICCWNSIYVSGVNFILLHDFNNIIVIHIRFVWYQWWLQLKK